MDDASIAWTRATTGDDDGRRARTGDDGRRPWETADDGRRRARVVDARAIAPALVDAHGRGHNYLRISLTERCNLRCAYCMPAEGVDLTPDGRLLTASEVERLVHIFARAGVDKVRLTGGEPTVRRDLEDIVRRVSAAPGVRDVSVTTNGVALERRLEGLKANGLTRLNLSLDTLVPAKFEFMTRRKGQERVMRSIDRAVELGFDSVKVNVVVMRGQNDDEILDFVELTKTKPINVRFIEYMPFDGNKWSERKMVSYAEMRARIDEKYILRRADDPRQEVAKNFYVDGHVGTVSFITSMTNHFCSGCNRLRIMADGNLKVCLFGNAEVSLRDAMREGATDDEILKIIGDAVQRKKAKHAGMHELADLDNRAMIKIGG
ncbi:MoaA/nifB/pqqE, iron-sulphur binding, conserved site [Ostreococcus tauri]|uniref:GTP 3',8-cyclase n=1 Tax=Ostreococcus tauri TaxID=70448 RepID=Q010H6_OSTTA|nr:MoaA/nifB/pqqE, iron-sulphur binding, conserved site [Ostreococcus tauri]CAL56056.1 MoaA/nifB/pqqE, iron-sulphur binding, conserved site [Ostreococcus tauri]|eukprot:XP_003081531.1 MoaA/nifB/pqqE, iron-sulphur binding, conserved site [Ostreococcus tauri]